MKKILVLLVALAVQTNFAQNVFPSTGNVGIGTNSPTAKLETLNTTPGITSFKTIGVNGYLSVDNVGSGENYYSATNFHEFQIGGTSKVRINSNGNVGIGTTNPTAKLHVNSTDIAAFFKSTTNAVPVSIINDGTSVSTIGFKGSTSLNEYNVRVGADGNDFISYTNNIERMRINSNGNVGIGTTNPTAKLHVNSTDIAAFFKSTTNAVPVSIINDGTSVSTIGFKGSTSLNEYNVRVGADGNDFISYTNNIERMRINSNGNVGIGTSNPIGLLDVQKSASNAGGQSVVNITGSTWTGDGASVILNQVWNGNYYKTIIDNNGGNYAQTGSGLKIQTSYWDGSKVNSITSLVLSPVGNLGLGTAIPDEKLTVNGKIHAQEVRIDLSSPMTVPDYVFANDYKLKSLQQVENYIKENNHLPEIPSANEIEKNGLMLAEMNMSLLKKIEELTLYAIEQQKNTEKLIQLLDEQNKRLKILEEGKN